MKQFLSYSNQVIKSLKRATPAAGTETLLHAVTSGKTLAIKLIQYCSAVSVNNTTEIRVYNDSGVFQYDLSVMQDYYNHHSVIKLDGQIFIPEGWEIRVYNTATISTFDATCLIGWEF